MADCDYSRIVWELSISRLPTNLTLGIALYFHITMWWCVLITINKDRPGKTWTATDSSKFT